jgi:16S rRNA (guanine966-N2)-methyltransferase
MRVIAGSHRAASLRAPRGNATRPTSDRVREALFSVLGDVEGADVLDLFAGSGALGIEALSRGAASAVFVDSASAAVAAIRHNLEALGLREQIVKRKLPQALKAAQIASRHYDLVFLDPPYQLASAVGPALSVALEPVLGADARVVTESDRRAPMELEIPQLPLTFERNYGDTLIRIYGRNHDS